MLLTTPGYYEGIDECPNCGWKNGMCKLSDGTQRAQCPYCSVILDLHPYSPETIRERFDIAERKVRMICAKAVEDANIDGMEALEKLEKERDEALALYEEECN